MTSPKLQTFSPFITSFSLDIPQSESLHYRFRKEDVGSYEQLFEWVYITYSVGTYWRCNMISIIGRVIQISSCDRPDNYPSWSSKMWSLSRTLISMVLGCSQLGMVNLKVSFHFGFNVFHFTVVSACCSPSITLTKGSEKPTHTTYHSSLLLISSLYEPPKILVLYYNLSQKVYILLKESKWQY